MAGSPLMRGLMKMICRRMPLTRGHSFITRSGFVRRWFDDVDAPQLVRLQNGIRIEVDVRDYNGRMLYLFGMPDPKVVKVTRALLSPGDRFIDIGANYGAIGLLCADVVGENGEVHLVEPQPELCQRARACIAANSLHTVHVHQLGMWDCDDVLRLHRPAGHSGQASFASEADGEILEVPVRHAGRFVQELIGDQPFGAKVDVEGVEDHVIPPLLALAGLKFLVFECNPKAVGGSLWGALSEAGLTLFGIQKSAFATRLRQLRQVTEVTREFDDLVAVPLKSDADAGEWLTPAQLARLIATERAGAQV